jgi:hypothetical protein
VAFVSVPDAGVPKTGVTKVGDVDKTALPVPVEVVTPVPPEPTGKGLVSVVTKPVLIDNAVEPLDCSAKTPLVSAVDFRPDEPEDTPLSALIVAAMLVLKRKSK